MFERARWAAWRLGPALAAVTLLLSVLVHFSADLTWLRLAAMADRGAAATVPTADNSERTSLADPNGEQALLPLAWSVPGWSSIVLILAPISSDRALTRPPLLQPPAFHPTI